MTVLLVAAPLTARSGVYRSTIDLVTTARAAGLDWRAVVGVRPDAHGVPTDQPGIVEHVMQQHGLSVLDEVSAILDAADMTACHTVITMVPQSDIAVGRHRTRRHRRHVAWVRGLPWPGVGEQSALRRRALMALERRALRGADEVWATSPLLADQIRTAVAADLVPAGVPILPRSTHGEEPGPLLWAGRLSIEKGADRFVDLAVELGVPARVHGHGDLEAILRARAGSAVEWAGWSEPAMIWRGHGIALCTSSREAFGRSPVEAASAGMPVVLTDQTGVAPLLYSDPALRSRFVLHADDRAAWRDAVTDLRHDESLRRVVSDHVHANATALSIEASFAAAVARLDGASVTAPTRSPRPARGSR